MRHLEALRQLNVLPAGIVDCIAELYELIDRAVLYVYQNPDAGFNRAWEEAERLREELMNCNVVSTRLAGRICELAEQAAESAASLHFRKRRIFAFFLEPQIRQWFHEKALELVNLPFAGDLF